MYSRYNMPVQTTSLGNYLTSRKSPAGPYKPVLQRFNQVTRSVQIFRESKQEVYTWHNNQSIGFKFSIPNHKGLVLFKVKLTKISPLPCSPKGWMTRKISFQVAKLCQYGLNPEVKSWHTIQTDSITSFTHINKNLNYRIQRKKNQYRNAFQTVVWCL